MKYTTKELTRIQGTHDPYNCEIINCDGVLASGHMLEG
jgi:hypothetical protein